MPNSEPNVQEFDPPPRKPLPISQLSTTPGTASVPSVCPHDPNRATGVRAFFTFGIDLVDYEKVPESSIDVMQELRAAGKLLTIYGKSLSGAPHYKPLADTIRKNATKARGMGGKAVWSDTFLDARAPWSTPAPTTFKIQTVDVTVGSKLSAHNGSLADWTFSSVRGYLSADGVIILTVSFNREGEAVVDYLIGELKSLRKLSKDMFMEHASEIAGPRTDLRKALVEEGFTPGGEPNREKVRAHRTVFVHSFSCERGRTCDPHHMRDTTTTAGLLNLAEWYPQYHLEYRRELAEKEFGYKANELFLTDRDATLCVQTGFFDSNNSLHLYMGNVLEAVEYHVGVQALLRGQLQYARQLYSTAKKEGAGADAAEDVRRSRAILSGAYESLNYSVLVLHGFTRKILSAMDIESEVGAILRDVERRIQNLSDAVALQSAVQTSEDTKALQRAGNRTNRQVLVVAFVSAIVSAVALAVAWQGGASGGGEGSQVIERPVEDRGSGEGAPTGQ